MKWRCPRALPATLLGVCFALLPNTCRAGDLESWNSFTYTVLRRGRVEWSVGGNLRVRDSLNDLYDRIFRTKAGVEVGKGVAVIGRYMTRSRDVRDFGTVGQQRLSVGLSYPMIRRGNLMLEGETSYERYLTSPPISDYNRYRQRFKIGSDRTGFSPKLYQDFAVLQVGGLLRSRSRAGFQWASAGGYALSVQYQFETINIPGTHAWHPVHAIVTEFGIDKPIWKSKR